MIQPPHGVTTPEAGTCPNCLRPAYGGTVRSQQLQASVCGSCAVGATLRALGRPRAVSATPTADAFERLWTVKPRSTNVLVLRRIKTLKWERPHP